MGVGQTRPTPLVCWPDPNNTRNMLISLSLSAGFFFFFWRFSLSVSAVEKQRQALWPATGDNTIKVKKKKREKKNVENGIKVGGWWAHQSRRSKSAPQHGDWGKPYFIALKKHFSNVILFSFSSINTSFLQKKLYNILIFYQKNNLFHSAKLNVSEINRETSNKLFFEKNGILILREKKKLLTVPFIEVKKHSLTSPSPLGALCRFCVFLPSSLSSVDWNPSWPVDPRPASRPTGPPNG